MELRSPRKQDKGLHTEDGKDSGEWSPGSRGISKNHTGSGGLPWTFCHLDSKHQPGYASTVGFLLFVAECVTDSANGRDKMGPQAQVTPSPCSVESHCLSGVSPFPLPVSPNAVALGLNLDQGSEKAPEELIGPQATLSPVTRPPDTNPLENCKERSGGLALNPMT